VKAGVERARLRPLLVARGGGLRIDVDGVDGVDGGFAVPVRGAVGVPLLRGLANVQGVGEGGRVWGAARA
jgi:hypothetical protein